jgi:hypothetical protein
MLLNEAVALERGGETIYLSVIDVRLNCRVEITLHHLRRA